jgi:hypothetical protein
MIGNNFMERNSREQIDLPIRKQLLRRVGVHVSHNVARNCLRITDSAV